MSAPPDSFDINVSPDKRVVMFADEASLARTRTRARTRTPTPTPTPTPTLTLTPARASLRAPPPALRRLKFVRDEASMSIDAYKAVFERSLVFGVRKLNQVRRGKWGPW